MVLDLGIEIVYTISSKAIDKRVNIYGEKEKTLINW